MSDLPAKLNNLNRCLGELVKELPLVVALGTVTVDVAVDIVELLHSDFDSLFEDKRAAVHLQILKQRNMRLTRLAEINEEVILRWTGLERIENTDSWRGQFVWKKKEMTVLFPEQIEEIQQAWKKTRGLDTAYLTIKEEEDADMALVESWNDRRRASIYMLLYHQGMRESTAREILRKTK